MTTKQEGACKMDGRAVEMRVFLQVKRNGELKARVGRGSDFTRPDSPWEGTVEAAGRVRVSTKQFSSCKGVSREYTLELEGTVAQKEGRAVLSLKGVDQACPAMRCVFLRTYMLEQKPERGVGSPKRLHSQVMPSVRGT